MAHKRLAVFLLVSLALLALIAVIPASAQSSGGTFNWSIEGVPDLPSLDPAKASDAQDFTVIGLIYGGLVRFDGDLNIIPDLADSWTVSDDALSYTFKLRDDAKFSDGTPITSADVIWSLEHALDPNSGGWTGSYYLYNIQGAQDIIDGKVTTLTGATALDDKTVVLALVQPSAYFLDQLTFGSAKIIDKAAALADPTGWDQKPVSSGAFMVQQWNHGQNLILVPNPNFPQVPQISTLTMPFIQDSETAYQLYRTGQLDIMGSQQNGVPAGHLADVQSMPDFKQAPSFATRYVGFDTVIPPFDNVHVRRAFALAIDKDTLANQVLAGAVAPTDRILPPGIPSSELPVTGLHFDAAAAKDELSQAGVTADSLGSIKLTYGTEGDNERVVTVLQSMWLENLGVKVELDPLELTTFSAGLNAMTENPQTGYQMYFSIWGADYPDPQNFTQLLHSDVAFNNGHYSNKQYDALLDQADVMTGDLEGRMKLYNQAEQIAVDEVGWLPLFNPKLNVLVAPYVEGIVFTGQGLVIPDFSKLTGKTS
ncbi:MAG: peptide ABC transporter substrate-binding protein [Chloroflexota bacterium]